MHDEQLNMSSTYKCLSFYNNSKIHDKIWSHLGGISKNVFNITLFCKKSYDTFKNKTYQNLYYKLQNGFIEDANLYIHDQVLLNYDHYKHICKHIKDNNNYIYAKIKKELTLSKYIITTDNLLNVIRTHCYNFKNDNNVFDDGINSDILCTNIVTNIIMSIYRTNYRITKECILEHKKPIFSNKSIYNDIKNERPLIEYNQTMDYKKLICKEFNVKFSSDQNYVGRLVYKKLNSNYGKIDSTMIGTIIEKIYKSYDSFYQLRKTNCKTQQPKYLYKDEKFTLNYVASKCAFNKENKTIRIHTSKYLSKNFHILDNNYCLLKTNTYIHKKYLTLLKSKKNSNNKKLTRMKKVKSKLTKMKIKPTKKNAFFYDNYYILKDDENIINSKHAYISYPDMLHDKEIKTIELVFENNRVKYCINYKNKIVTEKQSIQVSSDNSIAIDLGVKNLLTIYDPTGKQYIISGKSLLSTNYYFSKKIAIAQKNNNSNKIQMLNNKRNNIVNNYFNLIVKWMELQYNHKKMIIIGYNKGWKQNTNLGKRNNMTFNKIPYLLLIKKLRDKFTSKGIIIKLNEESYTSKCDALSNEPIRKHENYFGKRITRGIFSSKQNKLINADINGAINIMRKVFKNLVIVSKWIFNPICLNIFHEASCQWIMENSTSVC